MPLNLGSSLGHYDVTALIGEGGMGQVYQADGSVAPKRLTAFRLDPELIDGLKAIKERTGAPIAEQVRRAIVAWLKKNDVKRSGRKRARQRST